MTTGAEANPALSNSVAAPQGIGFLLGAAHRARRRAWEADLGDLGLTAPQAALLRLIAARPGSGVRHLARDLGTDPMNVQRIAETLIAAGFCEARRDPRDARRRPLYATCSGSRLASEVAGRSHDAEQRLSVALGADHYQALLTGLHALLESDRS
jgi:DNA-binding MarR family transcriptional regulator